MSSLAFSIRRRRSRPLNNEAVFFQKCRFNKQKESGSAMIDGIKRRLGKTAAGEAWGADGGLKPQIDESTELRGDGEVSELAVEVSGQYVPDDPSTDFYKSLVRTAIENGGRHSGHSISIPWLRMILAGLESKPIEPEMMWYGIEAGEVRREPTPEVPSYEDLFLSSRDR